MNENPGLQTMHTLWVREHNRVARLLAGANPHLADEELYQEARRYVMAQWQNTVYSEFLPIVLGPELHSRFGLSVHGPSQYKKSVQPDISTEFATAAFRFGHSLISKDVVFMGNDLKISKRVELKDNFFKVLFYFYFFYLLPILN